ncbi:hypothetical protein LTS18_002724, partial [Coniosporium uncinatum]
MSFEGPATKQSTFDFTGGWGGWGSGGSKFSWGSGGGGDAKKEEKKDKASDSLWGGGFNSSAAAGKKGDSSAGFDFGFDAGGGDLGAGKANDDSKDAGDDGWADGGGFNWGTTSSSKKKDKAKKSLVAEVVESEFEPEPAAPEPAAAEEDTWGGWGGSKSKKKGKKGAEEPVPPPPPPPPPPEPPKNEDDDTWGGFSSGKKKKCKNAKDDFAAFDEGPAVVEIVPEAEVEATSSADRAALQERWDEWHKYRKLSSKDKKAWRKKNPYKDEPTEPFEPEPALEPELDVELQAEQDAIVEVPLVEAGSVGQDDAQAGSGTDKAELQAQWDEWHKWKDMSNKDKKAWRKKNAFKDEPMEPLDPEPALELAPDPEIAAEEPLIDPDPIEEEAAPAASGVDYTELQAQWDEWNMYKKLSSKDKKAWKKKNPYRDEPMEPFDPEPASAPAPEPEPEPEPEPFAEEVVPPMSGTDKAELQAQWDEWHKWKNMSGKDKKTWRKQNAGREDPFIPDEPEPAAEALQEPTVETVPEALADETAPEKGAETAPAEDSKKAREELQARWDAYN